MIFLDTETCGLVGPIVLIQYQRDDGPIILHDVWTTPVKYTLTLLEHFCDNDICAFNLSFDWFHVNKLYNILHVVRDSSRTPYIGECASICDRQPRRYCLKPTSALDMFLHIRKTKWQVLMDRRPIRIKRVPAQIAPALARLLKHRIPLADIFFYKRPGREYKWIVEENGEFCDVVLKFGASSGLKPLIQELFNEKIIEDAIPPGPPEDSYNPYGVAWERLLPFHIKWWQNERNREYASNDVRYLHNLYDYFDRPASGDDDSELAVSVGCVRWHGYAINREAVLERYVAGAQDCIDFKNNTCNFDSPPASLRYLHASASDIEKIAITSTDKITLDTLKDWPNAVGRKAQELIRFRKRAKELDVLRKLCKTNRFNPDFKVIGTKSGRMSGGSDTGIAGGSLNPQGIQRDPAFRALYKLADKSFELSGGDFEQFEVTIADAAYNDKNLRASLNTGHRFPALLGELLYNESYDEIMASKGTSEDHYTSAKNTTYGLFYGAQEEKLAKTAGISKATAEHAMADFYKQYPDIRASREIISQKFCSMRQPDGLGHEITWREPADSIESLLGFQRYFTLENNITRAIFELAQRMPKSFHISGKIKRRDREQTLCGATQSALFATAFQIQASNMRAACNHVIQSTGAGILKSIQRKVWDLQSSGVHPYHVLPMNIHDELMVVHLPELRDKIKAIVKDGVESFKEVVPLLSIEWKTNLSDWGEK